MNCNNDILQQSCERNCLFEVLVEFYAQKKMFSSLKSLATRNQSKVTFMHTIFIYFFLPKPINLLIYSYFKKHNDVKTLLYSKILSENDFEQLMSQDSSIGSFVYGRKKNYCQAFSEKVNDIQTRKLTHLQKKLSVEIARGYFHSMRESDQELYKSHYCNSMV